ncbi:MAG: AMP-binding protein [Pseudolabrys sp.]
MRHPESLALADPPNRQGFTTGVPRTLSFAQTDRAISAFAARLRGLGLQTDSAVAIQLPNTVESAIAFLGVLRAGMIPVPLPLLWRQEEIVAALRQVGARTIVSSSRIGQVAQIEIAMQSAVELFSIRHVCGFGPDLPDGIVPLDDIFLPETTEATVSVSRIGPAAAHVAAITFYPDANGFAPIARSHVELVARGMEIFLETGATSDTPILSTIPIGSFAGIGLTVVPWLLSGGALHLHHSFDPESFGAQCRAVADGTVILPTAAVAAIAESGSLKDSTQTVVALWRTPERFAAAKSWEGRSSLVDVTSFGETDRRSSWRRRPASANPDRSRRFDLSSPGAPVVIETSVMPAGTLALRGRMVPTHALQPHAGRPLPDHTGYVDTGFACNRGRNAKTLIVTALLCLRVATLCGPVVPVIARVRGDEDAAVPIALPSDGALPVGRLLARLQFATRVRALHATVLRRIDLFASHDGKLANVPGRRCSRRRNCADRRTRSALPDPQCRNGRASQDRRCTQCRGRGQTPQYRDIDGIVVGDGFSPRMVEAFLTVLAQDPRF